MSDLTTPSVSESSELSELKNQCADLQSQTHILRVALLLVIGLLCLFFWREASFNARIAQQMQPQVIQANQVAEMLAKQNSSFDKQLQAIQTAVSRLVDYGRTHPDYVPILNKYGVPVTPPGTNAAAPPKR